MDNHNASLHFNEDLLFVTLEPLKDSMIILVEDGTNKDPQLLGHIVIPVSVIEKRLDEHHEASLPIFIFIFITYLHLHRHCPRRHPTLPICSGFRGFLWVSWWLSFVGQWWCGCVGGNLCGGFWLICIFGSGCGWLFLAC